MAERRVTPDCPCCAPGLAVGPAVVEVVVPDPTIGGGAPAHCPCVRLPDGTARAQLFITLIPVANFPCWTAPMSGGFHHVGCTDLGEETYIGGATGSVIRDASGNVTHSFGSLTGCLPNPYNGENFTIQYAVCSATVAGVQNECGFTHYPTDHDFRIGWEWSYLAGQARSSVDLLSMFGTAESGHVDDPINGVVTLHSFVCSPFSVTYRVTLPANNPYFPSGVFDVTITP